jgi:tRNA-dihydrouridine synthase B
MLLTDLSDRPLGVQLLGNDAEVMVHAIQILRDHKHDLIDINAACPVAKVTRRGEGSAMLNEPRRLFEMLKCVVSVSTVPITLKIRSGWDHSSVNAVDIACGAQEAGVSAVFIHGRTREQGYAGAVDYQTIKKVKESLVIPVIGSGNSFSASMIKRMFDETGCDGVAIARGALGNPWIFREASHYLKEGTLPQQHDVTELVETMKLHLDLSIDADGEMHGTTRFRKLFAWYVKGLHDTRSVRTRAFFAETREQMMILINELGKSHFRTRLPAGAKGHYEY